MHGSVKVYRATASTSRNGLNESFTAHYDMKGKYTQRLLDRHRGDIVSKSELWNILDRGKEVSNVA